MKDVLRLLLSSSVGITDVKDHRGQKVFPRKVEDSLSRGLTAHHAFLAMTIHVFSSSNGAASREP